MRFRFRLFAFPVVSIAIGWSLIVACSSESATLERPVFRDDKDAGAVTRTDARFEPPPPPPDASAPPSRIYAHTLDTLYLYDTAANAPKPIGKFSCVESGDRVLDIALDRTGAMYGTTDDLFISIDPISATCDIIKQPGIAGQYPNSLSFVPAGTVDATKEALVGYAFDAGRAERYVRIDTQTGEVSAVGDLNAANAVTRYAASGDLVSLIQAGNKTYLTVKKFEGDAGTLDTTTDYLAEVDPATGRLVKVLGPIGFTQLFGFGYWAGKGYGFTGGGQVVQIDMASGDGTLLTNLTVDGGAGSWFGAGVTTQAPVTP